MGSQMPFLTLAPGSFLVHTWETVYRHWTGQPWRSMNSIPKAKVARNLLPGPQDRAYPAPEEGWV
jgi:hypothetical protein